MSTGLVEKTPAPAGIVAIRQRLMASIGSPNVLASFGSKEAAQRCMLVAADQIAGNPKLLKCGETEGGIQSIMSSIARAGVYGWMCDGVIGQAALVPFNTNISPRGKAPVYEDRCQLIPGYKGMRDLVRRSNECSEIMESVHDGDRYEYRGPFSQPVHERSKDPKRKFLPVTHVYVLAAFRNGTFKCFSWTVEECLAHRDKYSQNWANAVKFAKTESDWQKIKERNPWHPEHPAFRVMCMKSVLLDAIHRGELPVSVEDRSKTQTMSIEETRRQAMMLIDSHVASETITPDEPDDDPAARAIATELEANPIVPGDSPETAAYVLGSLLKRARNATTDSEIADIDADGRDLIPVERTKLNEALAEALNRINSK